MKKHVISLALIFIIGISAIIFAFRNNSVTQPYVLNLNDIIMSINQGDDQTQALAAVEEQLNELYTDMNAQRESRDLILCISLSAILILLISGFSILLWNIRRRILLPFRKLNSFAKNVATGNLDIPIEMDKNNFFGAFTESFDLMRVELARAREAERQANQSKRELVASLSHDIKTPIASIKAVSELMIATSKDEKESQQLEIIGTKADQIDLLISNMFSATLEELQELNVSPKEIPSTALSYLISNSDYRCSATIQDIPECLIIADEIRLAQVLDNIFTNSYKYADTGIDVTASLNDNHLCISISDHGEGVPSEELPLVCQKFYRGKNAQGKTGTGLGLYISKYLMEKMSGNLQCENQKSGFTVNLILTLA